MQSQLFFGFRKNNRSHFGYDSDYNPDLELGLRTRSALDLRIYMKLLADVYPGPKTNPLNLGMMRIIRSGLR